MRWARLPANNVRLIVQRHSRILRDHRGNARSNQRCRRRIIPGAQDGNHLASESTDLAVRKNRLEAVTDVRVVFAIVRRQQDEHASIASLFSDSPLLVQINCVFKNVFAVRRFHRNHGDLRIRLLLDLMAKSV